MYSEEPLLCEYGSRPPAEQRRRLKLLPKSPADLHRGPSCFRIWLSNKSNLVASWECSCRVWQHFASLQGRLAVFGITWEHRWGLPEPLGCLCVASRLIYILLRGMPPATSWEGASTECQPLLASDLGYFMFRLVGDIHLSHIGSLYWQKPQQYAQCPILKNECQWRVNSFRCCIFVYQAITWIFTIITRWLATLIGINWLEQRYHTDSKLIDTGSRKACNKHIIGWWKWHFDNLVLTNSKNESLICIYEWTRWQPAQFRRLGSFQPNRTRVHGLGWLISRSVNFAKVLFGPGPGPEMTLRHRSWQYWLIVGNDHTRVLHCCKHEVEVCNGSKWNEEGDLGASKRTRRLHHSYGANSETAGVRGDSSAPNYPQDSQNARSTPSAWRGTMTRYEWMAGG